MKNINLNPKIDVFASIKVVAAEIAKEKINPKKHIKSKKKQHNPIWTHTSSIAENSNKNDPQN